MLCSLCSNIDLDQLTTADGYKHHANCFDLLQSAVNGCESCKLILDSQLSEVGGSLAEKGYDLGSLDNQITVRALNQTPGAYTIIRYAQETRREQYEKKANEVYLSCYHETAPEVPFLWSFLTVVAKPEDRSSEYLQLRPFADTADSPEIWYRFVSKWLKNCLTDHDTCSLQTSSEAIPPTRVIDVGPSDGSQYPFLHTSGDEVLEWVTLSHRWGQRQPLKTTTQNLAAHQEALPLVKLPALFHDAIVITRRLGCRYLWIDSLCIIQDSEADRMCEIAAMQNVYKHCVFTIAADNCRDSNDHILGNHLSTDRARQYVKQGCKSSLKGFNSVMYTFNHKQWRNSRPSMDDDLRSYLYNRAWVLQEQILSPRTIHWTPLQVVWSCRCTTLSEETPTESTDHSEKISFSDTQSYNSTKLICLPQEQLSAVRQGQRLRKPHTDGDRDAVQIWYQIVREFLSRSITFEEDALPAISGLAREVARHTGYLYRAGLWVQDFHNGLLWSVADRVEYPASYIAPSWSWASVKPTSGMVRPASIGPTRPIFVYDKVDVKLVPVADIIEVKIQYAGTDEFGRITSAVLRLNAPFKRVRDLGDEQVRLAVRPATGDAPFLADPSACDVKPGTVVCWLDGRAEKLEHEENMVTVVKALGSSSAVIAEIADLDTGKVDFERGISKNLPIIYLNMLKNQHWGLILEPVGEAKEGEGEGGGRWKRVGIARVADDLFEGEVWEHRKFVVI